MRPATWSSHDLRQTGPASRLRAAICALIATALLPLTAGAQQAAPVVKLDTAAMNSCLKAAADPAAKYACIGLAATSCQEQPDHDSTIGMSQCLGAELDWWKVRLNESYDALIAIHGEGDAKVGDLPGAAPQLPLLEAAQKSWLGWREAECAYQQGFFQGGSGAGPAVLNCEMILTAQRAIDLGASQLQAELQ